MQKPQGGGRFLVQIPWDARGGMVMDEIDTCIIKSNHSTIFNSELQSKGIKTVFDLIDGQGNFSSWNPLAEKFNMSAVDFLEWYGIMKCIPREWKNLVNNTSFIPEMIELEQLSLYQHCIYIKDTFTDILKVKTNQIYDIVWCKKSSRLQQPNLICLKRLTFQISCGQKSILWLVNVP